MKKLFTIGFATLVGIYAVLSLFDWKSNYTAEKLMWQANARLTKVLGQPETTPDKTYEEIADIYRNVIKNFPKYPVKARAQIQLAGVYLAKKDFTKAREILNDVYKLYPDSKIFKSEATVAIAKSYEMEGNWPKAESLYKQVTADYPLTENGLTAPLYIGNVYMAKGQKKSAQDAFQEASRYYSKLIAESKDTGIQFRAMQLLADSYLAQGNWEGGLETLGRTLIKYPNSKATPQIIQAINMIAVVQLQDYNKAQAIYENFMKEHPKHPLNNILKKVIGGFKVLKDKNVVVTPKKPTK